MGDPGALVDGPVLFEADGRLGGHANTADAPHRSGGATPVDTGFIVYNAPNYPNFTALLDHLGVASIPADMSLSVSLDDGGFEYSSFGLGGVFAQKRNLFSARFWAMLRDITRFYRRSLLVLRTQIDNGGAILAANDSDVLQYNRDSYSYLWPRDGALVAHALDRPVRVLRRETHGLPI